MKIKIYQIKNIPEYSLKMYLNSDMTRISGGIETVSYELVFEGNVEANKLDDIYTIFNLYHPEGYTGRSLSVSDIVWADGLGWFFCDSFGWTELNRTVDAAGREAFNFKEDISK